SRGRTCQPSPSRQRRHPPWHPSVSPPPRRTGVNTPSMAVYQKAQQCPVCESVSCSSALRISSFAPLCSASVTCAACGFSWPCQSSTNRFLSSPSQYTPSIILLTWSMSPLTCSTLELIFAAWPRACVVSIHIGLLIMPPHWAVRCRVLVPADGQLVDR